MEEHMSTAPENSPVTRSELKAELAALEQRLTEHFERILFVQQAREALAEFDAISQTRDTNPHGYTEEDVPRLVKEARAKMAPERINPKEGS
jgi:hypothetical protein